MINEYIDDSSRGLSLKVWLRLLLYFAKLKKGFVFALIIVVTLTLIGASFPLFTRYAVDNFVVPGTVQGIFPFIAVYSLFILAFGILCYLYVRIMMTIDVQTGLMIRRDCFVHLQNLQIAYHNTNSVGYLIGRVISDTERICGI